MALDQWDGGAILAPPFFLKRWSLQNSVRQSFFSIEGERDETQGMCDGHGSLYDLLHTTGMAPYRISGDERRDNFSSTFITRFSDKGCHHLFHFAAFTGGTEGWSTLMFL